MTLGDNGALYFNGTTMKHYSAINASVVDTSGAGDAFTGSLAAGLVEGKSMDETIKFAVAMHHWRLRKGASSMPSANNVGIRLKRIVCREYNLNNQNN